jgi:hypothetical protein
LKGKGDNIFQSITINNYGLVKKDLRLQSYKECQSSVKSINYNLFNKDTSFNY